ncbi:MAG: enoyl-CoA hydratase-related protein [Bacteroidota bacterium]
MEFEHLLYNIEERIATITLNRPEKRNALNDKLVIELGKAFENAESDSRAKLVVLRANGDAFCAGADIAYLQRLARFSLEENLEDSKRLMNLLFQVYRCSKPTVAAVQGPALAGGCGLAAVCDFVIASRSAATFGCTEVHLGFIPAIVMVFLLKRIGEGRARELVVRGNVIDAETAERIGLITEAAVDIEERVRALVDELLSGNSGSAMARSKEMLRGIPAMKLEEALEYAASMNASTRLTDDCKRGLEAFIRKERVRW